MTTTTLIQRIKDLTARFGKGWHDGIQIDASDIADLCLAADALEQQAAQIEALQLTKAGLIDSLREEMDEGLRLRELGGALPNENITAMTERLIGERAALAAELSALRADAERYRWLRMRDWFNSELCVLRDPKRVLTEGIGLGADCPSLSRLDAAIDAALRQEQPT